RRSAGPLPVSKCQGSCYQSSNAPLEKGPTILQRISHFFGRTKPILRTRSETPRNCVFPRRWQIFDYALPVGFDDQRPVSDRTRLRSTFPRLFQHLSGWPFGAFRTMARQHDVKENSQSVEI